MSQTRRMSILEVCTATVLKFMWAMLIWQYVVAPLFDYNVTIMSNFQITMIFTVNGMAISYVIRRLFNHWQHVLRNRYNGPRIL
jgi:hypothetical protein